MMVGAKFGGLGALSTFVDAAAHGVAAGLGHRAGPALTVVIADHNAARQQGKSGQAMDDRRATKVMLTLEARASQRLTSRPEAPAHVTFVIPAVL